MRLLLEWFNNTYGELSPLSPQINRILETGILSLRRQLFLLSPQHIIVYLQISDSVLVDGRIYKNKSCPGFPRTAHN